MSLQSLFHHDSSDSMLECHPPFHDRHADRAEWLELLVISDMYPIILGICRSSRNPRFLSREFNS
jgi:hypothetical protein